MANLNSTIVNGYLSVNGKLAINNTDVVNNLNAQMATKLTTARTLWEQSFDGTADITGNIYSTGHIAPATTGVSDIGSSSLKYKDIYAYGTIYASTFNGNSTATDVSGTSSTNSTEARHIWFSSNTAETQRVYDSDFTYNPSTKIINAKINGSNISNMSPVYDSMDDDDRIIRTSILCNHTHIVYDVSLAIDIDYDITLSFRFFSSTIQLFNLTNPCYRDVSVIVDIDYLGSSNYALEYRGYDYNGVLVLQKYKAITGSSGPSSSTIFYFDAYNSSGISFSGGTRVSKMECN